MKNTFFNTETTNEQLDQQRRDLLKIGGAGLIASMLPLMGARSAMASTDNGTWKIAFRHAHTGESFSGVYRVGDKYLPEAFERINYVLRDFRTKEVFPMDPHMIDILSLIHKKLDANDPYNILSAYRSPKTNAMLGKRTRGVASNSFHMYGQATDIRIPGYGAKKIRNVAKSLKAGGVGYYPRSGFVHVDTGAVRSWTK